MLPRANRLTDSQGFTAATRGGRRAGGRGVVVHVSDSGSGVAPQVGLIVSRAVGGAVVRTQVKRRLRHQVRDRLDQVPAGALVAVRALPAAARMSSAELGRELDRCLSRVGVDVSSRPGPTHPDPSPETVTE